MELVLKQSEAASVLGISTQALNRLVNGSTNTELKRTEKGGIEGSSVMDEMARRYKMAGNALKAATGQCLCCLQPTSSTKKRFISGHDAALNGALLTLIANGGDAQIGIVKAVLDVKGVSWARFIQDMQIGHLIEGERVKTMFYGDDADALVQFLISIPLSLNENDAVLSIYEYKLLPAQLNQSVIVLTPEECRALAEFLEKYVHSEDNGSDFNSAAEKVVCGDLGFDPDQALDEAERKRRNLVIHMNYPSIARNCFGIVWNN